MKLVYAMCGSFCTHKRSLEVLKELAKVHSITPVLSEICQKTDTRFGKASDLASRVEWLTGNQPVTDIKTAEEVVTNGCFDCVAVAPCTGNTLAKISAGITDSVVTMCTKAQLRSKRPVVIALATNDGLSANLFNIAMTLERKNIFYVPFGQDNPLEKPSSLICSFDLIPTAITFSAEGRQMQPILLN